MIEELQPRLPGLDDLEAEVEVGGAAVGWEEAQRISLAAREVFE